MRTSHGAGVRWAGGMVVGLLAMGWLSQTACAQGGTASAPAAARPQPSSQTQIVILWPKGVPMSVPAPYPPGTTIMADRIILAPKTAVPRQWILPPGAVVKAVPIGTGETQEGAAQPRPPAAPKSPPTAPATSSTKPDAPTPKCLSDKFSLPPTCLGADGALDHAVIVDTQKERMAAINKELSVNLRLVETPHFLIFSVADTATTELYKKWCELLYNSLCNQFLIIHKERVWDGKCVLVLLQSRSDFEQFSGQVDGRDISKGPESKTEAYFQWERYNPVDKAPQLTHIVLCFEGHDPKEMRNIFAHEGTHAFVAMFRRGDPLPRWLNEGLAMYMTVLNDPPLKADLWQHVAAGVGSSTGGSNYDRILYLDKATFLTPPDYPAAYTMVEYLCKLGGQQSFRQFMIQLKEGKDQDAAMRGIYNCDRAKFAKQWHNYVASYKVR